MRKFAVLNPLDGTYTYTTDEVERDKLIVDTMFKLFMSHVHDSPYTIVETTEDGKEQWYTPKGDNILNPNIIEEAFIAMHVQLESDKTPVAVVP